jgi:two-component system sensor histidine kinase PilS (NtrC family)
MPKNLQDWLSWLIKLRIVVITTLLGVSLGVSAALGDSRPLSGLSWIIGIVYIASFFFYALLQYSQTWILQAYLQIAWDLTTVFFIIRVTGGIDSSFSFLYLLSIIMASILLFRKGAFLAAFFSSLLLTLEYLFAWSSARSPSSPFFSELDIIKLPFLLNIFAFFAVAYLGSYLSENLRSTGSELRSKVGELASLQALHQNIINSMRGGLCTTNREGIITLFNHSAAEISGIRAEDAIGMPFHILFQFPEWVPPDFQVQPMVRFEKSINGADGKEIFLGLTVAPLTSENTRHIGFVYTFQDLTEIKELEEQIRQKDRMAAMGRMAAVIAHEIRNPLTAISSSFKLLSPHIPGDDDQKYLLDNISLEIKRLYRIVTDFLTYCKPLHFSPRPVDLNQLIQDTLQILRNSPERLPNHQLEYHQSSDPTLNFSADPDLMRQLLWNLCTNSLKAMPEGGILTLTLTDLSDLVEISVADTGIGIPEKESDKIFEPFQSGFKEGTGLGLHMVSQIVEAHGGTIQLRSHLGLGTKFLIRFPKIPSGKPLPLTPDSAPIMP